MNVLVILCISCLLRQISSSNAAQNSSNFQLYVDFSMDGNVPKYWSSQWVTAHLKIADVSPNASAHKLNNLHPGAGIPGRDNVENFMRLYKEKRRGRLVELSSALVPHVPVASLGYFYRVQLASLSDGGHNIKKTDNITKILAYGIHNKSGYWGAPFELLKKMGLNAAHALIDVGCGWGRVGREFIQYLKPHNYYGLDPDELSIRSFIQMELGILHPELAIKNPTILRNDFFELFKLMHRGTFKNSTLRADWVTFFSVIKVTMPWNLKRMAIHRASCALRDGGHIVIYPKLDTSDEIDILKFAKNLSLSVKSTQGDDYLLLRVQHTADYIAANKCHDIDNLLGETDAVAEEVYKTMNQINTTKSMLR